MESYISFPNYNLVLYDDDVSKTILVGNKLNPILLKYNELVEKYKNSEHHIIIELNDIINSIVIKKYDSDLCK